MIDKYEIQSFNYHLYNVINKEETFVMEDNAVKIKQLKQQLIFDYTPVEKDSKMVLKDGFVFIVDNEGYVLSDHVMGKLQTG